MRTLDALAVGAVVSLLGFGCSKEAELLPQGAELGGVDVVVEEEAIVVQTGEVAPGLADKEVGILTAFVDADEIVGEVPHQVDLEVEVIPGTGHPPFTYRWDFGDATAVSTDKAPSHTYAIEGNFRASVIVSDSQGEIDQDYVDIAVSKPLPAGAMTANELRKKMPPEKIVEDIRKRREAAAAAK